MTAAAMMEVPAEKEKSRVVETKRNNSRGWLVAGGVAVSGFEVVKNWERVDSVMTAINPNVSVSCGESGLRARGGWGYLMRYAAPSVPVWYFTTIGSFFFLSL